MDFLLWKILIGALILVSLFRKNNPKQKQRRARKEIPPTAVPGRQPAPKPAQKPAAARPQDVRSAAPAPQSKRTKPQPAAAPAIPQPMHPDSQETLIFWTDPLQEARNNAVKRPNFAPASAQEHPSTSATKSQERAYAAPRGADEEPLAGFDLRKAVIWSEILRPKFAEEEA